MAISLIPVTRQARLSRSSVQSCVRELTAEEGWSEGFGAREELIWHVLIGGLHAAILHRRCGVQWIAYLERMLGPRDFFGLGGESSRYNVLFLDSLHISLDFSVNLSIYFALLTHLSHNLVLIGPLWILQRQVSLTLNSIKWLEAVSFKFIKINSVELDIYHLQVHGIEEPPLDRWSALLPRQCHIHRCLCGKRPVGPSRLR